MTQLPDGWVLEPLIKHISSKSGDGKIIKGKQSSQPSAGLVQGYSASGPDVWVPEAQYNGQGIIVSAVGARCGKTFQADGAWTAIANTHALVPSTECGIDFKWLWYLTNDEDFWIRSGTAQPFVKVKDTLLRPQLIPPLGEQKRIVETLDDYLSRLDKALAEVETGLKKEKLFKHSLLHSLFENLECDVFELGSISQPKYGKDVPKPLRGDNFRFPVVGSAGVMTYTEVPLVEQPSVLVGRKGNVGAVQMFQTPCSPVDTAYYLICPDDVDLEFMYFQLQSVDLKSLDSSTTIPSLRRQDLEAVPFKKPKLDTQRSIAIEIKSKLSLLDSALEQLYAINKNLKTLRRSILNTAFAGSLLKEVA
jgi:restriction endonuclease S subunit